MFITYEIRHQELKAVDLHDQSCPTCKNRGTLKMYIMQSYAWLFGPMIPYPKYAVLECAHCQETIPNKKWTKELEAIYKKEKATTKTPLRMWRGMIVVVSVFLGLFLLMQSGIKNPLGMKDDQQTEIESKARFATIQVNDVMMVSFIDNARMGSAGLAKVVSVDGNKMGIKISSVNYASSLDGFDLKLADVDDSKFSTEITYYDLAEFKKNYVLIPPEGTENHPRAVASAKLIINN